MITYLRQLRRRVRNLYHLTNMIGKEDVQNKTIYWVVRIPYTRVFYTHRVLHKATIRELTDMIQYEEPYEFKVTVDYGEDYGFERYTLNINKENMSIHNGKTIVAEDSGSTLYITKDKYNAKKIIREALEKRKNRIRNPWNYKDAAEAYKIIMKTIKKQYYVPKQK